MLVSLAGTLAVPEKGHSGAEGGALRTTAMEAGRFLLCSGTRAHSHLFQSHPHTVHLEAHMSITYDGAGVQAVGMLCLCLELSASRPLEPIVEVCTQSPHHTALAVPVKTCPV